MNRSQLLKKKIREAGEALGALERDRRVADAALVSEGTGIRERLEKLRLEVGLVTRLDREAQEVYRDRKRELDDLGS